MSKIFSRDFDPTQPGFQPANFFAIEVHGVCDLRPCEDGSTCCEVNDEHPEFFSVYLHYRATHGAGVECVGDFSEKSDAIAYAEELSKQYGWQITFIVGDQPANNPQSTPATTP